MKTAIFFLALFHSAFLISQDPASPENNIQNAVLCVGDTMQLGDKTIKFRKVISDSRCPKGDGITCIWAGEVKVLVEFYEGGKLKGEKIITGKNISVGETEILPGSHISIAEFFNVDTLNITGVAVLPYPQGSDKISPEEYRLNLKISEKTGTN